MCVCVRICCLLFASLARLSLFLSWLSFTFTFTPVCCLTSFNCFDLRYCTSLTSHVFALTLILRVSATPPPPRGGGRPCRGGGGGGRHCRGGGRPPAWGGSRFGAVRRQIEYIGVRPRKSPVDWFLVKMSSKKQHFYENTLRQANFFSLAPLALAISTPFGGRYARAIGTVLIFGALVMCACCNDALLPRRYRLFPTKRR